VVEHPYISFFPALRLAKAIDLGDWRVGGAIQEVPWRNDRFRKLAEQLLSSLKDVGLPDPAIVHHAREGLNGEAPDIVESDVMQAAVRFAVLDANDRVIDSLNAGLYLATSENAELYVQPIDEETGWITHRTGGVLRTQLSAGWKVGATAPPMPDAVLKLERPVHASRTLAQALFQALRDPTREENRRLRIAVEWHAAAMANPRAVTLQQRLIALKTGFEALFRKSDSRKGAKRLRRLFESATAQHRDKLPWVGLLWSPTERVDLRRPGKPDGEIDVRSELEDWFMALAAARNEIIHEGKLSSHEYSAPIERPLSRYAGELFWKGERVLREAIKAALGADVLLCDRLAEYKRSEKFARLFLDAVAAGRGEDSTEKPEGDEDDCDEEASEQSSPGGPLRSPRKLEELLADLGCPAANYVVLRKASGGTSASLKVARQMARDASGKWIAIAGQRSMLIHAPEYETLLAAGAEHELPDWLGHCLVLGLGVGIRTSALPFVPLQRLRASS
jgi:hypothetical protein